jgi:hypothetical protein
VLIANAVAMGDARGGWKGLDTAFLRDHLHAATAVGRMAAAAKAVELGYGIVADPGPSGRLGGGRSPGSPPRSANCTPPARLRSPRRSVPTPRMRRGRWRLGPPATAKPTPRSRT